MMKSSYIPEVHIIIVMGVSGAGKSTIGKLLAKDLGWIFYEGDEFHSFQSIEKMSRGDPLTEHDRQPWLAQLKQLIRSLSKTSQHAVISCSALKQAYRDNLKDNNSHVAFVYLKGSRTELRRRLELRKSHFMKGGLLDSQLNTLEEPPDALTLNLTASPQALVKQIRRALQL